MKKLILTISLLTLFFTLSKLPTEPNSAVKKTDDWIAKEKMWLFNNIQNIQTTNICLKLDIAHLYKTDKKLFRETAIRCKDSAKKLTVNN